MRSVPQTRTRRTKVRQFFPTWAKGDSQCLTYVSSFGQKVIHLAVIATIDWGILKRQIICTVSTKGRQEKWSQCILRWYSCVSVLIDSAIWLDE